MQDLQEFIDNAEHGVIYFSLGSVVRMEDLPLSIQNGLKEGFAELPQKILWKLESNQQMTNQPQNVYTRKWFPQYDIISENNALIFNRLSVTNRSYTRNRCLEKLTELIMNYTL